MINLFSDNGIKFLESVCFAQTLFAFDFDGTLSKIVKNPEDAKINKSTLKLVYQLSEIAPVAIISGRSLDDLKSKFNPPPRYLVGNHGLEGIHEGSAKLEAFHEACEQWKTHLGRTLVTDSGSIEGIEIEDKSYSIAVHYRKSRSKKLAKSAILNSIGNLTPSARIILGKCVVNIIPTGAPHKGVALLELMLKSNTRSAFYIGDDDTDEDVFTLPDPRIFSVRVGKKSKSQAKFYIQRQEEINILLETILKFMKHQSSRKQGDRIELG